MHGIGTIHMARHGQPDIDRRTPITAAAYHDWWARYQETTLMPGEHPPDQLVQIAGFASHLIASPLPRAQETMARVARGRPSLTDEIFVEAPLPAPPVPLLKLSPRVWGGVSRVFWWCGYCDGQESRKEAECRAERAADRLVDLAAEGGDVLLCAHGWFNRMTGKVLRERGWKRTHDGGDSYWAWRSYVPEVVYVKSGAVARAKETI